MNRSRCSCHSTDNIHNQPVDTPICWFADRSPIAHLAWDDVERMRQHIFFLGLAGIAENAYLHDFEQVNTTHCRRVFQFFRSDLAQVSLIRRRREGHWRSPWRASEILSVVPPAAQGRPTAAGRPTYWPLYRQDFLDALAGCVDTDDALSRGIRLSVAPFLRGNEMDEYSSAEQDVVWLAAAIEQLLGVARGQQAGRRGARLDLAIGDLFEAWWEAPELRLVRRWASHFYRKRNEIHGTPATANSWHDWAHALLATVVYSLAVKVLLARAAAMRFELLLKPLEQGERIGRRARKAGDDASVAKPPHLLGVGLDHRIAEAHLAVAGDDRAPALLYAKDGGAVILLQASRSR